MTQDAHQAMGHILILHRGIYRKLTEIILLALRCKLISSKILSADNLNDKVDIISNCYSFFCGRN